MVIGVPIRWASVGAGKEIWPKGKWRENIMANTPATEPSRDVSRPRDALFALREEVDRLFDDFGGRKARFGNTFFNLEPFRGIAPSLSAKMPVVNVAENDEEFEITAELPGIGEKDVDVGLADGVLTVKGEKKEEKEDKSKNYYLSERSYGSFQRSFRLPDNVDDEKITADVAKGILTVKIPKTAPAKRAEHERKIKIKAR